MAFSIKVNGTIVYSTNSTVDEVSMRGRHGEAGRLKVDQDTTVNLVTTEDDRDAATRATGPVANAGIDQSLANNATCTLDASASTGDGTLTYFWEKVSGTGGTLSSATAAQPTYTTHAATDDTTIWSCTVTDQQGRSDVDFVAITVA